MPGFNKSKNYRNFVNERDLGLESLLHKYQIRVTDETNLAFTHIMQILSNNHERLINGTTSVEYIDLELRRLFKNLEHKIIGLYHQMRKSVYLMTFRSETQAIANTVQKKITYKLDKHELDKFIKKDHGDIGTLEQRIEFGLSKLRNRIIDATKLGIINKDERKDFVQRIFNQLPKRKKVNARKALKKIKEADQRQISQRLVVGFTDDADWLQTLKDYQDPVSIKNRSPDTFFDVETADGFKGYDPEVVYGWEIERDMTHDFVVAVREGVVDAAKAQGITDFIVVSIIDDKTCEHCCGDYGCIDFDGKTTSEIEKMTKGAQVTPPFHFNCRCSLAPFDKDLPELETSNQEDFDQWLKM